MPFAVRFKLADVRVAVENGAVVGYSAVGPRTPLASNRHVMRLRALLVAPNLRGRGLGRLLLADAEARAASAHGASKLALTVLGSNLEAIGFYERHGYSCEGRLVGEFRIEGNLVDDLIYAKWIGSCVPHKKFPS